MAHRTKLASTFLLALSLSGGCSATHQRPTVSPPRPAALKPGNGQDFKKFSDAAIHGDRKTVEAMLKDDPSLLQQRDEYGFTVLYHVVGEEQPDMIAFLIDKGADVKARSKDGSTPLHLAQTPEAVKLLIIHGADPNAQDLNGLTALNVNSTSGEDTGALETIEALLDMGADPNLRDSSGKAPLDYAKQRNEPEKVRLLKAHGAK